MRYPQLYKLFFLISFFSNQSFAQETRYFLFRHAEKDTSSPGSPMMMANPPLNEKGKARALKLVDLLAHEVIDTIFSTPYLRTQQTVQPLAQSKNKIIEWYDPQKLDEFAAKLQSAIYKNKCIVIVGHSNTTPALVNLLLQEKKYASLPDSVYNQYWIVTKKKNNELVVQQRSFDE